MESRHWLIRKANNKFSRPISQDEVVRLIESENITELDEISPTMGHWFSIRDIEETRAHFGELKIFSKRKNSDEITETATSPVTRTVIRPVNMSELFRPAEPENNSLETPTLVRGFTIALALLAIILFFLIRFWLNRYSVVN